MEGCDLPVILGKDLGGAGPQHQQWTEFGSAHHLPTAPDDTESTAAAQLGNERASFCERLPGSAAATACSPEPSSKEVSCNDFAASFASLQAYMEPPCASAHPLLPLQEDCGSDTGEEEEEEESDIENLAGEIVYQPDGSAYIVESLSQLSQGDGGLPPLLANSALAIPDAKSGESAAAVPQVYPQIINTFHIASSFGKWFEGPDEAFPSTSALVGLSPVLHSFRVFDVRHRSNRDYLNSDGSAKSSCVSKDVPNNVDMSKFDSFVLYGKRKPILMCFLCKLSFGFVRSFVSHAVHDHRITLSEEERKILSNKNISAIIQGIGKDKEPLVSFLEPKNKNFSHPLVSATDLISPGHSFYGKFSGIHVEREGGSQTGVASTSDQPQAADLSAPGGLLNLGGLTSSALKTPITSVPLDAPSSSPSATSEGKGPGGPGSDAQGSCLAKAELSREDQEEEEEEEGAGGGGQGLFPHRLEQDPEEKLPSTAEPGLVANGGSSPKDLALSNQSVSPLMSHVLQGVSRGLAPSATPSAPSFVFDGANRRSCLSFNREGSQRPNVGEESANRDDAPELSESLEGGEDGLCLSHHQHGGPLCDLGGEGCPSGGGVECPKCDTVLGSSRSLGGHMTMMHSRNSCKTLKCPKCNWHYKYQQTLEAHMKEKHPEPGGTCAFCQSGQLHPRLARGESYTCGYKPFRCEVCNYSTTTKGNLSIHMQSDKHLNNMQTLQNGSGEQGFSHAAGAGAVTTAAVSSIGGGCGAPSPTKPKSKPSWRCEVCDYETNVARNLRIHMTSEKHMHNMVLFQQKRSQVPLGLDGLSAEAELYNYYLGQNLNVDHSPAPEAQFLTGSHFQVEPSHTLASVAPSLVGGEIPLEPPLGGGQLVPEELMNLGETFDQSSDPSRKLFQCAMCNKFTTDALDLLGLHLNAERVLPEEEWKGAVGEAYQCRLCHYSTQLKANFQLHCKTEKHLQKYQLVAHIREGGKANEWRLKCMVIGNPLHLKCNACDYYTNSLEKLRLHTGNYRHEASLKLYKHLQKYENRLEGEGCFYHCVLCNYSTKAKLNLVQHVRSLKHQRTESLHKLKRLQKSLPEEEEDLGQIFTIQHCPAADIEELIGDVEGLGEVATNPDEAAKEMESVADQDQAMWAAQGPQAEKEPADPPPSSKHTSFSRHTASPVPRWPTPSDEAKLEQVYHCLYCKYSNPDVNRLRVHVVTQHSIQPMLRCPLCQDLLSNKLHLKLHLTHLHSVSPDCVEKLLLTVTTPEAMMPSNVFPTAAAAAAEDRDGNEESLQPPESSEEGGKSLRLLPEAMGHGSSGGKPAASEQPGAREETGFFCWKKGCGQGFKSSSALQAHFSETHGKRPQLPVSDRHVYKYRCNQCSLAFKTIEKLQLHSQYHVIRAATMCCLCQRSFRTFQALKKHLETSHLDLSEADIQQLYSGLLVNGELFAMGDLSLAEDHTMVTEEEKEEENSDQEDKQSPAGSDCGSLQEDSGSEPKRALPFRKGPNFTLEKFLDPARPYKCTVCKESFTQKNILLVHYNSVSHLHKLKRALQESSASQSEATSSPDHKPFKCSICSVAYSQSSTLEIHMRSVLHQTKARAAKLEAVSGSGHSSASLGSSMPSLLGVGTTSLTSPSSSSAAAQSNVSKGSTSSALPLLSQASCDPTGQPPLKLPIQSSHPPAAPSSPSEPKETNRKKPGDALACRQPLPPPPNSLMQAQLQQELQQQASLLQAQLFSPALLPHFPMAPETLLQQQQLLFPFYFPSAELQLNAEVSLPLTNGTLTLAGSGLGLLEDLKPQLPQPSHPQMQQQQPLPLSQPPCVLVPPSVAPDKKAKSVGKEKEAQREQEMAEKGSRSPSCQEPLPEASKAQEKTDLAGPTEAAGSRPGEAPWLPPRIAADARGNATKALLENFGFELVIQYNENKQKAAGRVEQGSSLERLECESCSKFFSNVLILKTHQEHIHQHYLPFQQLESFAQQYREHYDELYPLRPLTPEPAPPPPPAPAVSAAPPQPPSTPTLQVSASPMTSPSLAPNQPSLPHTQLPMPMELPLFSPLMMPTMPLQALPAQLPPQLAPVDSLPAELAQLYQHQLNPGLLQQQQQQQQNKRPRTRITDEQLRVLRQYFDINNSPSEEQIKEMAEKSGLPQKVIKHWFRNTLFKERQRNKDSPYNFSNPPITSLEDLKVDSRPSSPEPQKHEYWGSKRSSRTRFTDYQLRVLQDFFDANAYPKDDEFEQLSNLLNLPTRVIVVWFQNARQKARKNYENQGEGKEGERRELTNDRYIRTSNLNYQCKKCSLVFQRIFDLIKHQKKLCYKDEDEEGQEDSQNEDSMDAMELLTPSSSSCSTPMPSQAYGMPTSSASAAFPLQSTTEADGDCPAACQPKANAADEKPKHPEPSSMQQSPASDKQRQPKQDGQLPAQDQGEPKLSSVHPKVSPPLQQQPAHPLQGGLPQASPPPAQLSHLSHKPLATPSAQQLANLPPQLVPYQCEQCKLAFPSFEHWQEHQQLHFLSTQGQFLHPQFDLPFMLFDTSNPLLASQLLSGTLSQLPMSSATSPSTPTATMSTLKRKLEEKARVSPVGNDGSAGGEEPQRDKRLRTTITPEQLEVLYQKYLLDSNPTRKMLDHIAHEVGLKKRVVQVWFQNTRARERKGQFRAVGPAQAHRRCPFCRALFKAKTALEAHIRSRHWHEAKRAGYNLALSAMLLDCEGGGGGLMGKGDLFDGANFAQLSAPGSSSDSQGIPPSPGSKSLELSPQTLLSPSSIKVEGMEDLESPSVSSVHLSFDQAKLDNDDCSSVNTALTDTTTGDETNADNDSATGVSTEARGSLGPSEGLTKSAMLAMSEYEDRLSSGLVSPAPSFHSKEYDNEGTVDYSETSSLADPCSPSPGTSSLAGKSGDGGDRPGQKRFRTQMTNLQLKVLKACFSDYRTPTMLECEVLGNDIGLPKRVIQVWFQNARAKEKKSKLNMAKHFGINQTGYEGPKTECTLCGIKYSARLSVRDHIFSEQHISKVKETVGSQLDKEKEYFDPATVRQLMAQQELDRIKKANEALGLAAQQQGMFDSPPLQALNIPASYPAALQSIPPVLLPGLNSPSLPGFTPSNTALTSPKPALMGLPGTSVPSPGLPTSGSPNKTASLSSPPPAQTSVGSATPLPLRKDKESEKVKEKERPPKARGEALSGPKKDKGEAPDPGPAFSATGSALEYSAEPTQLQALQAALNTESMALLTNPFLPCFVPGFSPYYAPQLPGALQSGYLQPMYTMEGVFPYGPALSQALLGVSPGSLLQHYQQYQQSLQEALQRQVQLPLPKGSQPPVPAEGPSPEKGPAKESPRPEEKNSSHQGSPRRELTTGSSRALDSLWDPFIVPPVQYRLVCRKCQARFGSQEAADVHLKSLCCFGQSMGTLPEMALQVLAGGGGSYQCVACESTVCGEEALQQHLESAPHRHHQTVPRAAARNAKEHPSQLPHSACLPDPSTASTSQPTAHPKDGPLPAAPPHASKKPWPPAASPPGKPPPLSSSSTVTSSSCSTSGVQPSLMPRKFSSEESDSGHGPEAEGPVDPSSPRDGGLPSVDPFRL